MLFFLSFFLVHLYYRYDEILNGAYHAHVSHKQMQMLKIQSCSISGLPEKHYNKVTLVFKIKLLKSNAKKIFGMAWSQVIMLYASESNTFSSL